MELDGTNLQELLTQKATEVASEPEHRWTNGMEPLMRDEADTPVVRVGVTNCSLDMNIWEGLQTPAHVGLHPLGLEDIWTHFAAYNVKNTRFDGSPNPMAVPETFEEAKSRFQRAVIISAMLPMNPGIFESYANRIEMGETGPFDHYMRQREEVRAITEKSIGRAALNLLSPDRAVIPMTRADVERVAAGTRGAYRAGSYHGPANEHWPQNSVAVLTGLLRFGVCRIPFRDEVWPDGSRKRLMGSYASMVVFDSEEPTESMLLDSDHLAWLRRLSDYTDTAPEVVASRYCTYNTTNDGDTICGKCIEACPSGALTNSSPQPDGIFEEAVANQKHRFWGNTVDFDMGNCCNDRGQKMQLYSEYNCARCEATCASRGVIKSASQLRDIVQ